MARNGRAASVLLRGPLDRGPGWGAPDWKGVDRAVGAHSRTAAPIVAAVAASKANSLLAMMALMASLNRVSTSHVDGTGPAPRTDQETMKLSRDALRHKGFVIRATTTSDTLPIVAVSR